MKKLAVALLFGLAAIAPASAVPWSADYHMGTFIASGGSEETRFISLECVDPDGGASNPGALFLSLTPKTSVKAGKLDGVDLVALKVDEGGWLPLAVERDGDNFFAGDIEASTRQSLLRMIKVGEVLTVRTSTRPAIVIADIPLKGSAEALDGVMACEAEPG